MRLLKALTRAMGTLQQSLLCMPQAFRTLSCTDCREPIGCPPGAGGLLHACPLSNTQLAMLRRLQNSCVLTGSSRFASLQRGQVAPAAAKLHVSELQGCPFLQACWTVAGCGPRYDLTWCAVMSA